MTQHRQRPQPPPARPDQCRPRDSSETLNESTPPRAIDLSTEHLSPARLAAEPIGRGSLSRQPRRQARKFVPGGAKLLPPRMGAPVPRDAARSVV